MIDEKKLIQDLETMISDVPISYMEDENRDRLNAYNYALSKAISIIKNQPKVGKWIPVEERLPDKDGEYLVYYVEDEERCAFADKEGCEVIRFDADLKAFGFWVDIFDYQILAYSDRKFDEFYGVVAWMPLPEPYVDQSKGEDEQ